jgi:hypothetical protein
MLRFAATNEQGPRSRTRRPGGLPAHAAAMIADDAAFEDIAHASLTIAEILDLDVVQRASPQVLAGAENLDWPVRWVHISERPDIADYLKGSELLLTTLMGLGSGVAAWRELLLRSFLRPCSSRCWPDIRQGGA